MKKLRIFDLLSSIQPIELKRFDRYIRADSVYASRDYHPLAVHLMKYYPDFKHNELTLESMYNSLYPGKKFNKRVIISRLSEFNRMTENFLLSMKFNKEHTLRSRVIAEVLMERKAYTLFDHAIDRMINEEENINKISERQLYEFDKLLMIKGQCLIEREKFIDMHKLLEKNIEIFLIYIVTRLLTMYCAIKNIEHFQIAGSSIINLKKYMSNIDLSKLVSSLSHHKLAAYMKVMVQISRLYDSKTNDELYFKAKKDFLEKIENFEQISKFTVFSFLYSYAVSQINLGRTVFNKEIYDLLKLIIKNKAYMKSGNEYMPTMLYREFILTALKQNDISGAEKFVKEYSESLAPNNKSTMMNYSYGKINMRQKNYLNTMAYYDKCPEKIQVLNLDMKIDLLVCLFELGNFDRCKNEINKNNAIIIKNKTISEFQKKSFKRYNDIIKRLIELKIQPDMKIKMKLIKDTEKIKILHHKEWILQQAKMI